MSDTTRPRQHAIATTRALWASMLFYALIAFEFFYMASPFGAYLYAVYGPGLDWLQAFGLTGWTIQFFLPHLVAETRSVPVDVAETLGMILFAGGLAGFAVGAFRIYRAKLRREGAVVTGIYRHIRHPQYLALIVASIGMALIWPRYLVVIATVTVIFIYIALARLEEGVCARQFPAYTTYMEGTGRFLPRRLAPRIVRPADASRLRRVAAWCGAYLAALAVALSAAAGLRAHALDALYTLQAEEGTYLSVAAIDQDDLEAVARLAGSAPATRAATTGRGPLLNYVLPAGMYVSEIPMRLPPGASFGHSVPSGGDPALYKVVFTEAVFDAGGRPDGEDVIAHAVNKIPLLEVHVDLRAGVVSDSFPPPETPFYGSRQVPVF